MEAFFVRPALTLWRVVTAGPALILAPWTPRSEAARESSHENMDMKMDTKMKMKHERGVWAGESDIVTVHVPNLPSTKGMIDAACFKQMKNDAIYISTCR